MCVPGRLPYPQQTNRQTNKQAKDPTRPEQTPKAQETQEKTKPKATTKNAVSGPGALSQRTDGNPSAPVVAAGGDYGDRKSLESQASVTGGLPKETKVKPKIDFDVNASGTLNLLEITRKFCSKSPFIFMSTNKVYGDNPNKLKIIEKKNRYELSKSNKFFKGVDESMSVDDCTHSFFGVSKTYADLIVQEYGKNVGLKTVCFRAGCITGPNHSGAKLHGFLSYLVKKTLYHRKYTIIGYKGKQVRDNLHSNDLINCFWEF